MSGPSDGRGIGSADGEEPDDILIEPMPADSTTPSKVTAERLQYDLRRMGLSCELTTQENLDQFIQDVRGQIPTGGEAEALFVTERRNSWESAPQSVYDFINEASGLRSSSLDYASGLLAGHEGADAFYSQILDANPGGREFVDQISGARWGDDGFARAFAENNPDGIMLLAELASAGHTVTASGTWSVDKDSNGRSTTAGLAELVYPSRFDRLKKNPPKTNRNECRQGDQPDRRWGDTGFFTNHYEASLNNAEAIRDQYVKLAKNLAGSISQGLAPSGIETPLTNQISALDDSSFTKQDYDSREYDIANSTWWDRNFHVFITLNQTPTGNQGVGVLSTTWRLQVEQFKKKKQKTHPTVLDLTLRSILYPTVYERGRNQTLLRDQVNDDLKLCPVQS